MSVPSASRPLLFSNLLLVVAGLLVVAWCASWFLTPMPGWHREVAVVALICVAFANILRRSARRRQEADKTLQL